MEQIVINIIDTHNFYPTVEKYTGLGDPVLSYSGGESLFTTIMSSKFSFSILNETAEDGKFLDLLTGEERRFLIEVRKVFPDSLNPWDPAVEIGSDMIWRGFLLPDIYSEPYKNGSFFVGFTATDGLDVLKTKPFLFYKTGSVIDYISKCLWETGLHQEIYFAPAIENAFYQWENIQIFEECFTKFNENTDAYQYSNCYDVLDKLLKAVGATVFQHNGKWLITGFNRKSNLIDSYRVYTPFGIYSHIKQLIKKVQQPMFGTGVNVSMASPYRSVQLNVSYNVSDKAVDFSQFIKNTELSSDEYTAAVSNGTIQNIAPFNKWKKNAATAVRATPEDGGVYLQLGIDTPGGMHPPEAYPMYYRKAPFCITMGKVYGPPHNFDADYIELKSSETVYISPQVDGKDLEFDVEMECKIFRNGIDQGRFDNDFYARALRVDLMLGDEVVFTTRSDHPKYDSGDTKLTFHAKDLGPVYHWYIFPDYLTPAYRLSRYEIEAHLKAEVKRTGIKSNAFGNLNVRVYIPKNGDETFGINDYHVSDVTITKLDVKVRAWDDEQYQLNREIRYTTKFESSLAFADGKNDLYLNLFKINGRNDYPASLGSFTLFTGTPTQSSLYYHFMVPGIYADYINSRYTTLVLHSEDKSVLAHKVFGKLGVESGIDFQDGMLRVSKARIDEFPHLREQLNSINKITVAEILMDDTWVISKPNIPRDHFIGWKRHGSAEVTRYLETYAKTIHQVTATTATKIEGTAKAIVSPLDIVQFNFLGQKNFIPTSVNIDFTKGATRLTLSEAINQNVIDYANES